MAGEDEAGRTPPTAEQQAPQAQTQAQTTTPSEPAGGQPDEQPAAEQLERAPAKPGFGERGRMRRRARFLRKARELAYRDLGGLVYDLHRFGQRNDPVVLAKLATLGHIDAELRALEQALHEIRPVSVLREVGIAACPRCAAIHGNEDRFCPGCGLAFSADADRPLSTAPVTTAPRGEASTPAGAPAAAAGAPSALSAPASTTPPAPASAAATGPAPAGAAPAPAGTAPAPAGTAPAPAGTAPAPASPALAGPLAGPAPAAPRPAAEPLTTIERPPAPALKPTAMPVAARPPAAEDGKDKGDPGRDDPIKGDSGNGDPGNGDGRRNPHDEPTSNPEDEPTQILRPPAGGA